MVAVDLGVALGLLGITIALASVLYARAQAGAARRQADAARLAAEIQLSDTIMARIRLARREMFDEAFRRAYLEANPPMEAAMAAAGGFESFIGVRNFLDMMQEVWVMRRAGVVADHQWRAWATALPAVSRVPQFRSVVENVLARDVYEPRFAQALRTLLANASLPDPRGT